MPDVLSWLRDLPQPLLMLAVAATLTVEAGLLAGVLVPGASAVLALGVLARAGVLHPVAAGVTVAAAAVAGTHLAYLRGRQGALSAPANLRRHRDRASLLLRRRGPLALCLAQWFVVARTLTPRVAGYAGLSYRRFALASVPSAVTWAAALTAAGYLAAAAYDSLSLWFGVGAAVVAAAAVLLWTVVRPARRSWRAGHFRSTPSAILPCPVPPK